MSHRNIVKRTSFEVLNRSRLKFILAALSSFVVQNSLAQDTTEYEYDALGRLEKVTHADGTEVDYDYDAAGNRESKDVGGGSPPPPPPPPPGNIQITDSSLFVLPSQTASYSCSSWFEDFVVLIIYFEECKVLASNSMVYVSAEGSSPWFAPGYSGRAFNSGVLEVQSAYYGTP